MLRGAAEAAEWSGLGQLMRAPPLWYPDLPRGSLGPDRDHMHPPPSDQSDFRQQPVTSSIFQPACPETLLQSSFNLTPS